ncbi:MAG: bifunctional diaminohydroxyphosphoribosylaminopyrimidine deaminase/5-amino-6-(5-phosphoribosylamino)uracil reductase RibD [Phycisphaerae bacterium]|nr:bifunctional diaminohydroxyphosphoribosylaminopyrimidine deaminase/5-amino-6-(5-phosphoribosylamino)uracil reductase RibD [Phycisphaerae bacterium]
MMKINEQYMLNALVLASQGYLATAPNPMVGAIIVKDKKVIGSGYHQSFGHNHAEVNAIEDCIAQGHSPADATMFVTLEPCCHFGKTPPCTDAIIKAKIKKVFVATIDNSSKVDGKGIQKLREHNIEVEVGLCQKQAQQLNAGFFKLNDTGKPLVILKWAQSLDAKLAWPIESANRWLTNQTARQHVHELRAKSGAIIVGIGTVLADNPMLNIRNTEYRNKILRAVIDSELQIPMDCQLVQTAKDWPFIIYTCETAIKAHSEKVQMLKDLNCQLVAIEKLNDHLSLEEILIDLGKRNVLQLIVEGGPTTLAAFYHANLADELMVYVAPIIIGSRGLALNFDFPTTATDIQTTDLATNTLYEIPLAL